MAPKPHYENEMSKISEPLGRSFRYEENADDGLDLGSKSVL